MRNAILLLLLWLAMSVNAHAETASYHDGILVIPEVLSFHAGEAQLFRNAELHQNAAGTFDLLEAEQYEPAGVESLSTTAEIEQGEIAVVHINGLLSAQCLELRPVVVSRQGTEFHLVVTESAYPENVRCIAGAHPFLTTVELASTELEPGLYSVHADGLQVSFRVLPL